MIIMSRNVSPVIVLLNTVTLCSDDPWILLPLTIDTFAILALRTELVIFTSKNVEFSIVALIAIPLDAVAFKNVLFETKVPMSVTFVSIEPEIVLFSTRLFVIVELVIFTLNARTVLRSE